MGNVCHRDLKPENYLLLTADPIETVTIKLIDFGLSCRCKDGEVLKTGLIGTRHYIAPEVWKGSYDKKCDVWSTGVIMYSLLSGQFPFAGETEDSIRDAIM